MAARPKSATWRQGGREGGRDRCIRRERGKEGRIRGGREGGRKRRASVP